MSPESEFRELIQRVRAGDDGAAEEIVARYEPLVRRELRMHMHNDRLRRVLDSVDVCQSVLASFFLRAAAGEYDLERPDQLASLLTRMARNKLASAVRFQQRQRRDHRRTAPDSADVEHVANAREATPISIVAVRELQERLQAELTEEERRLAELRAEGRSWNEIAAELGGSANSRRMQLSRAMDRVAGMLADVQA